MCFVHRYLKPAPCCVCMARPWNQLHHFAGDGGMGLKPSDLWVARLCRACAQRYEVKLRALQRDGRWNVLAAFAVDALRCLEEWVKHMALGNDANDECADDELITWLASPEADGQLIDRRTWLLRWADRRAADLIDEIGQQEDDDAT